MNPRIQRTEPGPADLPRAQDDGFTADSSGQPSEEWTPGPSFTELAQAAQAERATRGGRKVLGAALVILAVAWMAYSAWSAGTCWRPAPVLPGIAHGCDCGVPWRCGPRWIMFGRTSGARRAFTHR